MHLRKPEIKRINDHVWLLNENNEATGYVVAGADSALVIDTMVGMVNVKKLAEDLAGKPVTLVNTHGHLDHIAGNWSFDEAYLSEKDFDLARRGLSQPKVQAVAAQLGLTFPKFIPLPDGHIFDLGGIELEVIEFPGHTAGEVVLLDWKDRILFSGDAVIEQLWMQLPDSLPIHVQIESMRRGLSFRNDFDAILSGHSRDTHGTELYDALLAALVDVAEGNTADDVDYEYWGGCKCKAHPYGKEPRRVVYNP